MKDYKGKAPVQLSEPKPQLQRQTHDSVHPFLRVRREPDQEQLH